MHGKGLQPLDMDAVLPVAHLQGEELRVLDDDRVGPVVQWREEGVVAILADQYMFLCVQCIWEGFRGCPACCGVVLGVVRCCCVADKAEGL